MSNESEQIEARLAAYIDGLLPDDQRAEIERYLTANPSHRALIEDLRRQSKLVSSLPRAKAPAEVMDHLQSHLERNELLQDVEQAATSMRINRSPQILAIAAVALLAVGLAVLVVQILPSPNQPRQVVLAPTTPPQLPPNFVDNELGVTTAKDSRSDAFAGQEGAKQMDLAKSEKPRELQPSAIDQAFHVTPGVNGGIASNPAAGPGEGGAGAGGAAPGAVSMANAPTKISVDAAATPRLTQVLAAADNVGNKADNVAAPLSNAGAIVIRTDDPALTQNLVAQYLNTQGFAWHTLPEPRDDMQFQLQPTVEQTQQNLNVNQLQSINSQVSRVRELTCSPALNSNGNFANNAGNTAIANQQINAAGNRSEQVIVVRNVTPGQAVAINGAVNLQRSGRQQAQYYANSSLNDLASSSSAASNQSITLNVDTSPINPLTAPSTQSAFDGAVASKPQAPGADLAKDSAKKIDGVSDIARAKPNEEAALQEKNLAQVAGRQADEKAKELPAITALNEPWTTTQPTAAPTDVVIIVEPVVPAASTTQPATTQPATTQPTTAPTTPPTESLPILPAIDALPSTQPTR